jgi:uncharacterized membrane protein YfcA
MHNPLATFTWLCLSAVAAGAVNALAGGGTLLTFPTLLAALSPLGPADAAVVANATSTVALVPGSLASAWGYRREVRQVRHWVPLLIGPSLAGGALGALLMTRLPSRYFAGLVPWLILTAALLFLAQPLAAKVAGRRPAAPSGWAVGAAAAFQFLVAVYGGYFGAGIGILMLSALGLMGLTKVHEMNALKSLLAVAINGVSVVVFAVDGKVRWPYALAMAAASVVGGYLAARVARTIPPRVVRWLIILVGFGLAAHFFARQWAGPPPVEAAAARPGPRPFDILPARVIFVAGPRADALSSRDTLSRFARARFPGGFP